MEQRCPERDLLEDFLLGKLDDVQYESVVLHIDQCDSCKQRVDQSSAPADTFAEALRETVDLDELETERECAELVERLYQAANEPDFFQACHVDRQATVVPSTIGPYEFLESIGSGGMGTVYRARHTRLKREVAIKVLREDRLSARQIARFEREIEAIGKVDHPNIVRATEADERDGTLFLVMELVDGANLNRVAMLNAPMRYQDACELIRQTATGLQHAHEHGLVHRDIKPSNLLLTRNGTIKIADLGLAMLRAEDEVEPLTALGAVMGTPDYLAPEQWEDTSNVDIRADIYSTGCTLYYLLAGRAPFQDGQHTSAASKMKAHFQEEPTEIKRELPAELLVLLKGCLAKSPNDRPDTPGELARALQPFTAEANLQRLILDADGETLSMLVETPDQAKLSTMPEMQTPSRSISRCWVFGMLAAGCAITVLSALWQLGGGAPDHQSASPIVDLKVIHYQYDAQSDTQQRVGQIDDQYETVAVYDEVRVEITSSAPAWLLLIALNTDGTVQSCFPSGAGPKEQADTVVYPARSDEFFSLADGPGQQGLVVLALSKPFGSWQELQRSMPELAWKHVDDAGVWRFDGNTSRQIFPDDERPRGKVVRHNSAEFHRICTQLMEHPNVLVVRGIAFSVRGT